MNPLNIPGIANGYAVDAGVLWRGAQPLDCAWPLLAAAGCKSVIDLSNAGDAAVQQAKFVTASGMFYLSRPWSGILPPSQESIAEVLASMDSLLHTEGAPIFVHCLHGSDRTGTLCACWRMHRDGMDFEEAMKEAFLDLGTQGMREFWMAAAVAEYAHAMRGKAQEKTNG